MKLINERTAQFLEIRTTINELTKSVWQLQEDIVALQDARKVLASELKIEREVNNNGKVQRKESIKKGSGRKKGGGGDEEDDI